MKTRQPFDPNEPTKSPTGITGFDEMTGGGLPRGRTSLLVGGPGSGKTIFGLQFLAHGVNVVNEPGVFVALEEASGRILANARGFGWDLDRHVPARVFFLDARDARAGPSDRLDLRALAGDPATSPRGSGGRRTSS